ncbi:methylated-DNA--protein-cysteine methyltransferase isoform X1 [Arvicanthis niloticus]|uniref:methylated-DNA--protein-cysteine methyltransferase isoform X1 n=2 Tax=Arvicanthis niloticus TaxID=61156 RepID=UPI0014866A28|nr:methylated-DNA--protein-cysteine methyltransferase [Arvicanthis niloticus]
MLLSVCTVCKLELGRMAETCKMKYTVLDSPLGKMELSGCEQGLHGIRFLSGKTSNTDPTEAPATSEVLGGPEGVPEPLVQCTAWLEAYFREPAATEGLPLPALHHPVFQQDSFTRQVLWKLLKVVKFGEMVSYQQLAALAGNPKAARAVGGAMRSNPVPILIPCHRVVRSDGTIGNYSGGGQAVKEWLLAHEGIPTGQPASKDLGLTETWLKSSFESTSSKPCGRN